MKDTSQKQNNNLLIEVISLVLGLFYSYFFYKKEVGISFFCYVVLILISGFIIAKNHRLKITKSILILVVPLLFFSGMIFIRSSESLTFFNFVICFYLLLMLASFFVKSQLQNYTYQDYTWSILKIPFRIISAISATTSQSKISFGDLKQNPIVTQVGRGLLFAAPLVIIFTWLFSSADMVFKKNFAGLLNFQFDPQMIYRTVKTFIVAVIFTGVFGYAFSNSEEKISGAELAKKRSLNFSTIEISILLGSINILFLIFISLQFKYLFGGEANIHAHGIIYSEYAREGFFQLIAAAMISFLLIRFIEKNFIYRDQKYSNPFKILSGILILQVITVIVSAFKRLMIYEDAYGFTVLRLYSHIFTIFLGIIFFLLLYKILINKKESLFAFASFLSVIAMLVFTNIINPDAFIVRRNIERFLSANDLDRYYLMSLSNDGILEIIKNIDSLSDAYTQGLISERLHQEHQKLTSQNSGWQSMKLYDHKLKNSLENYVNQQAK